MVRLLTWVRPVGGEGGRQHRAGEVGSEPPSLQTGLPPPSPTLLYQLVPNQPPFDSFAESPEGLWKMRGCAPPLQWKPGALSPEIVVLEVSRIFSAW